jgi:hypothetical protein
MVKLTFLNYRDTWRKLGRQAVRHKVLRICLLGPIVLVITMVFKHGLWEEIKKQASKLSGRRYSTWLHKVDGLCSFLIKWVSMILQLPLHAEKLRDSNVSSQAGIIQKTNVQVDHLWQPQARLPHHSQAPALMQIVTVLSFSIKLFYSTMANSQAGLAITCQQLNLIPNLCWAKNSRTWSLTQPSAFQHLC